VSCEAAALEFGLTGSVVAAALDCGRAEEGALLALTHGKCRAAAAALECARAEEGALLVALIR
jgi:hypothetical protein